MSFALNPTTMQIQSGYPRVEAQDDGSFILRFDDFTNWHRLTDAEARKLMQELEDADVRPKGHWLRLQFTIG